MATRNFTKVYNIQTTLLSMRAPQSNQARTHNCRFGWERKYGEETHS